MDVVFDFDGTSLRKYNTICIKTENLISFSTDNDCHQNNRKGGGVTRHLSVRLREECVIK